MNGHDSANPIENKYVQQHLANERTYLAWVRTCIAVAGLGFLAAGLTFNSTYGEKAHLFAVAAGVGALLFALSLLVSATFDYKRKRRDINEGIFRSSRGIVNLTLGFMLVLFVLLFVLAGFLLFG
ncbi:YidH family protein [Saccharibacillus alkalitolerans]|uniref:DUF202 domain-containing protein n=1 Tax=Saccharibacillus alkalitolerans TaxID=2705290 RepID=A0ABX0F7C0_9BACL|nr:DUF202 domain-containing protein [Saccharibacillus alkalitolerans]NGZ73917.1 DUF202 domain-containing protein [Saccharibacillus alkalitolerans]